MLQRTLACLLLVTVMACSRSTETRPPTAIPSVATATPTTGPADPFALARSRDASSPGELAGRLEDVEDAIRTDRPISAEHARIQQAAYRQLVRMPEWREAAYAALPGWLVPIARANVEAGAELRRLTAPRDKLPPWTIVPPPPADELLSHYRSANEEFGIDWTYLAAIHLVETRMGRIRGDSVAGAKGPMQFLPSTWTAYGKGDINDPGDAIRAAARYLRAHGGPGDMPRALYSYNHSDHYVRAIELYAGRMRTEPHAYDAYYQWDVYYRTTKGDALLYVGWPSET